MHLPFVVDDAVWQKYAEMEMSNRFVNRARNVFDRVVALLPRVEVFWYKYSHMEVRTRGRIDTYLFVSFGKKQFQQK